MMKEHTCICGYKWIVSKKYAYGPIIGNSTRVAVLFTQEEFKNESYDGCWRYFKAVDIANQQL